MATGAGSGYVLTSDAGGVGTWQAIGGGTSAAGWTDGGATVHLTAGSDTISLTGTSATEKLEVGGGVDLGEAASDTPSAGVIEWDGTNFRGYTGSTWKNLDEAGGGGGGGGFVDDGTIVRLDTPTDDVHLGAATDPSAKLGLTAEANQTALALAGYSLTGSSALSAVSLTGTWNTTGVPTLLSVTVTDTASGAASKLLDLIVGSTSRFSVSKAGAVVQGSGATLDYETTSATGTGVQLYRGNGSTPRTDVWTAANLTGVFTVKKGSDDAALAVTTGGLATFKGSAPGIGFDASTDWTIGYASGNLSMFSGQLPGGSGTEIFRLGATEITTYKPLVLSDGIGSHATPTLNDTYDLGQADLRWNQSFISSMNAVVFAEQTLSLLGGWFSVSPDEGTFGAAVSDVATTINFGETMTPGHFVEIRGYDTNGVLKAEYLQVGSLVSGTTYNVTRGLNGVSAEWPKGAPFRVNGTTGSGRVELNAYNTPRISLLLQGATYNSVTETIRIGDLNGMPGIASTAYGIFIGDASQYLKYTGGTLTIAGNGAGLTSISGGNITTGSITADQIATNAITADEILAGAVTTAKLSVPAAASGVYDPLNGFYWSSLNGGGRAALWTYDTSGSTRQIWLENKISTGNATPYLSLKAVHDTYSLDYADITIRGKNGLGTVASQISFSAAQETLVFDGTSLRPETISDGQISLGTAAHKFDTAFLDLSAKTSAFVPVVVDATGQLYYAFPTFDGCLAGKTIIGGIVTTTGC